MASIFDERLEHQDLVGKIILLAENPCHATIIIFPRADWGAFSTHACDVEALFLESLLQALLLACLSRHLLSLSTEFWIRISVWNN